MSANNITIRDSWVDGGDDNVCIKNDTSNVLVENIVFKNGHGATIGSVPDGNGLHGYLEHFLNQFHFVESLFGEHRLKTFHAIMGLN